MISHLELTHLPFVDGSPDADQKRIQWVRNGECLDGATTKYGSDGTLNNAPVAIQRNAEHLASNDEIAKATINILVDNVNNINETLEMGSDITTIQQIAQNKENIEILQVHMQFAENNIGDLYTDTSFLKEDLGVYDPAADAYYRPVRQDIVFLKNEIGNYPDQDKNGFPAVGTEATGMKRRIINNSSKIVSNTERIRILEENFSDSDIGSLSIKINEIREELGPRTSGIGKPVVYARLTSLEDLTAVSDQTIAEIKTAIGLGVGPSINTRMNAAEGEISTIKNTLNTPITGLVPRMAAVETAIGTASVATSINGRLATLRTDHNALAFTVGADASSGLRGQVAWLSETVGTTVNPAPTSVQGRLATVTNTANETASSVQDLQAEIGTNTSGLKGSVLTLTKQMNGTNPNGTTVEERGVMLSVKQLDTRTANVISEAPVDGKLYARKDRTWTVVPGADDITAVTQGLAATNEEVSSLKTRMTAAEVETAKIAGISEDTSTNKTNIGELTPRVTALETTVSEYETRIAELETELSSKIEACPQDGEAYVRVNNGWVLLSNFLTP